MTQHPEHPEDLKISTKIEETHVGDEALRELSDEEVLAMWRRGELVVRTGRVHHGNLCVCPEKGDGEWCDKCEGYALEQGQ